MNYFADPVDARDYRRAAARDRNERVRNAAIAALGGKCPKCMIESNPRDLKLIPLTEEAKRWSLVVFYRRVSEDPDRERFARLVCNKCRFNEVQERRLMDSAGNKDVPKGTGEFYWIGGCKVEQIRAKTGADANGHLVIHPRHEDFYSRS